MYDPWTYKEQVKTNQLLQGKTEQEAEKEAEKQQKKANKSLIVAFMVFLAILIIWNLIKMNL